MKKDYYKILEVSRTATHDEIKSQYRKLALKTHPDVKPNDKEAETKFKEYAEAYEILGDPKKKEKYDGGNDVDIDLSDFFANIWGASGYDPFGSQSFSDIFDTMYGSQRRKRKEAGLELYLTLEEIYTGVNKLIHLEGYDSVMIYVPKGISEDKRIRYPNYLKRGDRTYGDLYVTFKIKKHDKYRVKEKDVYMFETIDVYTAIFGGTIIINTPEQKLSVRVPEGTQPGATLRIPGYGIPDYGSITFYGDLFIIVNVSVPNGNYLKKIEKAALTKAFENKGK
jgi:curved DNA-binding protein